MDICFDISHGEYSLDSKGWFCDVLNCVNAISQNEFSLSDVYQYEIRLKQLHPDNNNIRAKIRQQLQLLRDAGYIEFLDKGYYRKTESRRINQYKIEISETVSEIFEVNATSEEEALRIARENYNNTKFVLEPGNLMDVKFTVMSED